MGHCLDPLPDRCANAAGGRRRQFALSSPPITTNPRSHLSLEYVRTDVAKLQEITARLQASDTAALEALQQLKDQNVALASQLAAVQTGDPATQKVVDDVVGKLTTVANTVDAAVAANPATPNLGPSPATPGGPPAAGP